MARTKIDYGIDLGTTNSAISRMENGEAVIRKTDTLKDTMPSCVYINKKKAFQVGDSAYNALKRDKLKSMTEIESHSSNSFIEFKRTMGSNQKYSSSNLGKELTSEELSAEILKTLKSFIKDESVNSAVITVPAAFKNNQIDATRRAGQLAGFQHVEVLQEPVAAAMAYGLDSKKKNGFWMVFDFGGGTFDAALLKVEDGIMNVIDTEGDNYLGGKNLDYAIIDKIILPYIEDNFVIDSILEDENKKQILRNGMKFYAEETKIKLSFNETHNILSDLGDIPGEDDEGEEFELDITVTQNDVEQALGPVFQKAIDLSLELLKRNNLKGDSIDSLILVGGPTFSPVLRKMLEQQICKPDTSADPMTVVAKGAALYASTVYVSEDIQEQNRDKTKIQLEVTHESSTVEIEEFVTVKILTEKTEGEIPENVFVNITRADKSWSSGKVEINAIGEVIDVYLNEGKTNVFEIHLYDPSGNILESEPSNFSIIQGSKIGSATLPYNIGIEIKDRASSKIIFRTVNGLEKNKSLPATGTANALKTQKQIRPGNSSDFIKIPVYQGEYGADKTRAIYNEHIYDIIISGDDLPDLLPEKSDVDLTVNVDKSQNITVNAYFPHLDHTAEIIVPTDTLQSVETKWLSNELKKARTAAMELNNSGNTSNEFKKAEKQIDDAKELFETNKEDLDTKQQVLSNLRKALKVIDKLKDERAWPELEKELKEAFYELESVNSNKGNEQTTQLINRIKKDVEEAISLKSEKIASQLIEDIGHISFELERLEHLMGFIFFVEKDFSSIQWKNAASARSAINRGKEIIYQTPSIDSIQPVVNDLYENGGFDKKSHTAGGIDIDVLEG
ncbi:Hsp70 family protein [Gillisia sp. Q332]|uniref:Hsp70 family protein n=1 Tax=Gillisia xinjiangensis TaxID=3384765 RepID=UPI00391BA28A